MCGGMEFLKRREGLSETEFLEAVRGSGGGLERLRVYFPNPKAALPADEAQTLWLPWGRRKEQPGDWPEGGWARQESLDKPFWKRWEPMPFVVHPVRWMEKDPQRITHWFEVPENSGILCLRLMKVPGTPLYVVTIASKGDYLAIHDRMPQVVEG